VCKLINTGGEASEDAIKRRFDTVITSDSPEELAYHLRGLIQLLRSKSIPLDYPKLAEDLFNFQSPALRDGIRLRWGQDYYFNKGKDEENNEK
jgi:CRISPR system Cascade subunit CasB